MHISGICSSSSSVIFVIVVSNESVVGEGGGAHLHHRRNSQPREILELNRLAVLWLALVVYWDNPPA